MTELVWEGKYDAGGHRKAPVKVALPFQTVETVNESAQQRQHALDLFAASRDPEWRNRLIWGDKKYVLPALLNDFAGRFDLIYIDPPFATGQDFSQSVRLGEADFVKEPSMIEVKAYRDTWGQGLDSYLQWFFDMSVYFRGLLAETGSLYVHLDPGVSHYIKAVLDEVFGQDSFRSEVVWKRSSAHSSARRYAPVHDVLLFYTKSGEYTWHPAFSTLPQETIDQWYNNVEPETGRRFNRADLTAAGVRRGPSGAAWRGINPTTKGRHWAIPSFLGEIVKGLEAPEALDALDSSGRLFWPKREDGMPMLKRYLEEAPGIPALDVVTDIKPLNNVAAERVGYPTQKPMALLERIIEASTNEGDLVLDCVCGSGTTAVAAERTGRRWIVADLGRFAVHTTRKRLLSQEGLRPFVVQNLGKYERQLWQESEFGTDAGPRTAAYRKLILDLYHATPVEGYVWLHGVKAGAMVHVGSVDSPVTMSDVTNIVAEAKKASGPSTKGTKTPAIDVLGWDFAFEVHEVASQKAAQANIALHFVRIPREVLDKRAVEQGDVMFFELAALAVDVKIKKRAVVLKLTNFVIPVDDVPDDVQKAIKKWGEWIDYWAVDWDNKGDAFHNEWQAFRTRKNGGLDVQTIHEYPAAGSYRVVVKVIDILGNDTTKTLDIEVI